MGDNESTDNSYSSGGRSPAGYAAIVFNFLSFPIVLAAFATPNWIAVDETRAPSGTKFLKLGLWSNCFKNIHDPYYYDPWLTTTYEGCRLIYWPVTASVNDVREYLLPGFFVPSQILYTLCFFGGIVAIVLTAIYLLRFSSEDRGLEHYLIIVGMTMEVSALLGLLTVVIFGGLAGSRTWAPEWQFNYLSWSYILAVIGMFFQMISGILFFIEAKVQWSRKIQDEQMVYTVESSRMKQ